MHGSDINHGVKQTEIGVIHHTAAGDLQLYLQQSAAVCSDPARPVAIIVLYCGNQETINYSNCTSLLYFSVYNKCNS